MTCAADYCETLGGSKFNAVTASFAPTNQTSLGDTGRHGADNTWARWSGRSKPNLGIASRSPYGAVAGASERKKRLQQTTLGGTHHHRTGLGVGSHGHGIGVTPSALGGPHNAADTPVVREWQPGLGAVARPTEFCFKCLGTWFLVGAAVLGLMILTRG
jgi:hypothetical protein